MKILFSVECLYPAELGGISNTVYWQAKALVQAGHEVTIVTTTRGLPPFVPVDEWLLLECGRVIYTRNPHNYLPLRHIRQGWQTIRVADVVHINSFFYSSSLVWVLMARWLGKPVVWSPHGELSPAALRFSPRLKRMALSGIRFLKLHLCFHATSTSEVGQIQNGFGLTATVRMVRNMMELPQRVAPVFPIAQSYLLFIGRLHPIKAIDLLLEAVASSWLFRQSDYMLLIAGPDTDVAYTRFLVDMVYALRLSDKVSFIGPVHGQRKEELYANAYLTILPSHSENFGNVVIESLAQGTPVIASTHTPWQLLQTEGVGNWVANQPQSLKEAIEDYLNLPPDEYDACRERAARLAREQFNIMDNVGLWEEVYDQVVYGPLPEAHSLTT